MSETRGGELNAISRAKEFLRQYRMTKGRDPQVIHTLYSDPNVDEGASLRTDDLDYLLKYAVRTWVVVTQYGEDRMHVYGPFTEYKARKCEADLRNQAVRESYDVKIQVKPLLDTERKNMMLSERRTERRGR